jgi:hypothetical protein
MTVYGEGTEWRYRVLSGQQTSGGWEQPGFDDSAWAIGAQTFATLTSYGGSTGWNEVDSTIQERLTVTADQTGTLLIEVSDDNRTLGVWVNGTLIFADSQQHAFSNGFHQLNVAVTQGQQYTIAVAVWNEAGTWFTNPGLARVYLTGPVTPAALVPQAPCAIGDLNFVGSGVAGFVDGVGEYSQFYHPRGVAFSPDGTLMYVPTWDGHMRVVNMATRIVSTLFSVAGTLDKVHVRPSDGHIFTIFNENTIREYTSAGAFVRNLFSAPSTCHDFHPGPGWTSFYAIWTAGWTEPSVIGRFRISDGLFYWSTGSNLGNFSDGCTITPTGDGYIWVYVGDFTGNGGVYLEGGVLSSAGSPGRGTHIRTNGRIVVRGGHEHGPTYYDYVGAGGVINGRSMTGATGTMGPGAFHQTDGYYYWASSALAPDVFSPNAHYIDYGGSCHTIQRWKFGDGWKIGV